MRVEVEQVEGRRLIIRARGNEIVVDDTIEQGGPGDGFRPTELLLGALATCMMGTMISFASNEDISLADLRMVLEEETDQHPERIGKVRAEMSMRTDADDRRRQTLGRVANACKIHNTLGSPPEIECSIEAVD